MAFPWIFESNFEQGTNGEWDSEADTGSKLDFPHYSALAGVPGMPAPFRGAYCMRIQMGDTNDHTLTEGDIDIAANATRWFRFYLYIGSDIHGTTADDTFNIFELQQDGGTVEGCIGIRYTAATDLIEIGIGETAPTAFAAQALSPERWYAIELKAFVDQGVQNDGTLDLYINGSASVAAVTALDQGAVGKGVLGTQDTLATTVGTLLFDQFVMDDAQIFPIIERFPTSVLLTKTGHVFVGPGRVENASLLSGAATDGVLTIYDTDSAYTSDASLSRLELKNVTNSDIVDPAGVPLDLHRGCYVTLAGTTPRAVIKISYAAGYSSDGAIKAVGSRRSPRTLNA